MKVLIISHDKVGPSMAGPGIRYHHIATELSKYFEVTLATFNPSYLDGLKNTKYRYTDIKVFDFENEFAKYDVIYALWLSEEMIAFAKSRGIKLVFDLYAPVPVEDLIARVFSGRTTAQDDYDYGVSLENYRKFLRDGDYFTCSNSNQKDFWVGYAFSANAAKPSEYSGQPLYDKFGEVPMGIDLAELKTKSDTSILSKRIKEIRKNDFVIVWTGGIWDWFDGVTPIKAINNLVKEGHTDIKLVFLGTKHPNEDVPAMSETKIAYDLANKLGVLHKQVFFLEGWIPYADRIDYLLSANVALYAHKPSIEARYSHRTRVLDHILTGLPTIATAGDFLGEELAHKNMGIIVPPMDSEKLSTAILSLKEPVRYKEIRKSLFEHQPTYTWENTVRPLKEFISNIDHSQTPSSLPVTKTRLGFKKKLKKLVPQKIKNFIKRVLLD